MDHEPVVFALVRVNIVLVKHHLGRHFGHGDLFGDIRRLEPPLCARVLVVKSEITEVSSVNMNRDWQISRLVHVGSLVDW